MAETKSRAHWQPDNSRKIVGQYVIEGDLILDTPTHFGNGETNGTEMIILEVANQPLLPGASIAGALRHYLQRVDKGNRVAEPKIEKEKDLKNIVLAQELFGIAYKDTLGEQSRVIIDDAISTNAHLISRDGVKIDSKTGIAADGQLFGVQLWNRGAKFPIRVEMLIYEDDTDTDRLLSGLMTALSGFDKREIPLGARKSRGYGECHIENWRVKHYDFQEKADVIDWVQNGGQSLAKPTDTQHKTLAQMHHFDQLKDARQYVRIDATFKLKDTLLIRSLSDVADTAHLVYEDGTPVLSGTSVAGALRARALKIAKTFTLDTADNLIDDMFGKHGGSEQDGDENDESNKIEYQASRLIVRERMINDPEGKRTMQSVQNRVKIDRFTGGAFETALIAQQPVFAMDDTQVEICLQLQYPSVPDDLKEEQKEELRQQIDSLLHAETGLLLLLLKDLWTGDLPLGGERSIGRGRLAGLHAEITVKSATELETYKLNANESFGANVQSALEQYVDTFNQWTRQGV